jgi:hypothetical protein
VLADSLRDAGSGTNPIEALNLLSVLGVFVALPAMVGRLPWSYFGYSVAMLVPLMTQESAYSPLDGALRHTVVIVPFFVLLAVFGRHAWVDRVIMVVFPLLMALAFYHFVHFGYLG